MSQPAVRSMRDTQPITANHSEGCLSLRGLRFATQGLRFGTQGAEVRVLFSADGGLKRGPHALIVHRHGTGLAQRDWICSIPVHRVVLQAYRSMFPMEFNVFSSVVALHDNRAVGSVGTLHPCKISTEHIRFQTSKGA